MQKVCAARPRRCATLPARRSLRLFCAPPALAAPTRAVRARLPADSQWRRLPHQQPAVHGVSLATWQRRTALQEDHHLPGGGQGQERLSGLPAGPAV
jgi:hypothetical protein